jgi:hypothetical protein
MWCLFASLEVDFGASIYSMLSCFLPCTYLLSKSPCFHFSPRCDLFVHPCLCYKIPFRLRNLVFSSSEPVFNALSFTRHVSCIKASEAGSLTNVNPTFIMLTSQIFILCCFKTFAYGGLHPLQLCSLVVVFGIILSNFHLFPTTPGSCQLHMK